jgi:hypothetical protein
LNVNNGAKKAHLTFEITTQKAEYIKEAMRLRVCNRYAYWKCNRYALGASTAMRLKCNRYAFEVQPLCF